MTRAHAAFLAFLLVVLVFSTIALAINLFDNRDVAEPSMQITMTDDYSGIRQFKIIIDQSPNTIIKHDMEEEPFIVDGGDVYIHVATVDKNGNFSETKTTKKSHELPLNIDLIVGD